MVDALVAMLIVAMTLGLSLQAVQQARGAAARAAEVRAACRLLAELMEYGPRDPSPETGARDGFRWRVTMETTGSERPIEVCRRAAELQHAVSGRRYASSTLEVCPVAAGA
jgi:hypothetical protein